MFLALVLQLKQFVQRELISHQQVNHPALMPLQDIMCLAQVLQPKQFVQRELISHQQVNHPVLMPLQVTM